MEARTYYERTGATLDAALAGKSLDRFLSPRIEINIFEGNNRCVAHVVSGRSYEHVLHVAEGVAKLNTQGAYTPGHSGYTTEVTVRGWS